MKFKDFPDVLKTGAIKKIILLGIPMIAFIVLGFFHYESFFISFVFLIALLLEFYKISKISKGKYRRFEGTCIEIKKPEVNIKGAGTFYGYSKITLQIGEMQVTLPVKNIFEVSLNDTVSFYATEENLIKQSNTTYVVNEPIGLQREKIGRKEQ